MYRILHIDLAHLQPSLVASTVASLCHGFSPGLAVTYVIIELVVLAITAINLADV